MPAVTIPDLWLPDPFTAVYNAIRTGMLAYSGFRQAINATTTGAADAHFLSWTDARFKKLPEQLGPKDLPLVVMYQAPFKLRVAGRNSMTCEVEQSFDLLTTVEDLRLPPLNSVKWNSFLALRRIPQDMGLGGLVREWDIVGGADDAFGQSQWKAGFERYVSMTRLTVQMVFSRQLLNSLTDSE